MLYTTVGQNVPLFKKKGEVAISGGHASTAHEENDYMYFVSGSEGFNVQAAAAIDSSLAITCSIYSLKNSDASYDWTGKGNYVEFGIGKFKHSPKTKLIGEVFFGTGFGSLKNSSTYGDISSHYIKPFIQPSGGFSSKVIDVALTARMGMVFFTSHSNSLNDQEQKRVMEDFYDDKKATFVFEPGLTTRIGFKNVKLQLQWNYTTFHYTSGDFNPVNRTFASVGLFILISDRWTQQKKTNGL